MKKGRRAGFLVVAIILILVAALLARQRTSTPEITKDSSVPELVEILGPDQNVRLKAARRLVERVGVDQAQEILVQSSLPNTGEGHLAVHQIGFYAYQKYGAEAILKCKDYFLFACYHGAIIEAAEKEGFAVIAKMTDRCKESPLRYFQCIHAAGHAVLAMWNYDLPEALKTCDSLFEKEGQDAGISSSCHNGAFMENLFGVHDWGTGKTVKRDWLSDDVFFPCNAFGEKYQRGCWLNQAARIYQMYQGDLVKTAQACKAIGNEQYTQWCLDNLSRQIHAMTNGDTARVFSLCQTLGSDWRDKCVVVNAGSYYSVGGRQQAIDVCRLVVAESKEACYQAILGQLAYDLITPDEKLALCKKFEPPFAGQCFGLLTKEKT